MRSWESSTHNYPNAESAFVIPFTPVCDAADACIVPAQHATISPTSVMGTNLFNLEKAQSAPGWLKVRVSTFDCGEFFVTSR